MQLFVESRLAGSRLFGQRPHGGELLAALRRSRFARENGRLFRPFTREAALLPGICQRAASFRDQLQYAWEIGLANDLPI